EVSLFSNWTATQAGINLRLEPSNNNLEWFVRHSGGLLTANFSGPAQNTWATVYAEYDNDAADGNEMKGRVNTTEQSQSVGTGQVLASGASTNLTFGVQATNIVQDFYCGEMSLGLFKLGTMSKPFTDALSNLLRENDSFVTF